MLFLDIRLAKAKRLLGRASVEHTFVLLGNGHKGMGLRSNGVSYQMGKLGHRVTHDPRLCIVQLKMQVRPCRVPCIAADGNIVACTYGQLVLRESEIQRVAPSSTFEQLLILVGKALQMAIDAGQPIRMSDVYGIAKAIFVHRQTRNVSLGYREYLLAFLIVRLDIQSGMKVPGTRLTEVACQDDVEIDRGRIIYWLLALCRGLLTTRHQKPKANKKPKAKT